MHNFLRKFDGTNRPPRPEQKTALEWLAKGWDESKVDVIQAPVGCHAKGTLILMADGSERAVELVRIGDCVQGVNGVRKVLDLHRGRAQMVRIIPVKGDAFVVNLDHILSLYCTPLGDKGPYSVKWGDKVHNISVKELLLLPKHIIHNLKIYRAGVEYVEQPVRIPPYILGIWLGDGSSDSAAITKYPGPMVDAWINYGLEMGYGHRSDAKSGNKASTIYLTNGRTGLKNEILGLFRSYSLIKNKHIPMEYLVNSRSMRLELLAGLVDSDGHCGDSGGIDFVFKSRKISEGLVKLARSLGYAAYMKPCKKTCTNNGVIGDYFRISISGNLEDIPCKYRKPLSRAAIKSVLVTGFSVELLPEDDYYGFEVDGDNLYLMADFTVTHNSGKSAVARAIQIATGAHIITPSNILVNQYHNDFPNVNVLKGKAHYDCRMSGMSCGDWQDALKQPACPECPYAACKSAAVEGQPTFFNPMSLYYATRHPKWTSPSVLVVDEAHQLNSMILMLTGTRLRKSVYQFDERVCNEIFLVEFLKEVGRKLEKLAKMYANQQDFKRMSEVAKELESVTLARKGVQEDAQNYAIWLEDGKFRGKRETFLNIKPIQPPKFVTSRLLAANKVILMSGTILPMDVEDLIGDQPYRYLDLPSPIPAESRPIFFRPVNYKMNWETDPKKIVKSIEEILRSRPGENTIIHVSYSLSTKLIPHFTLPILHNTAETKDAVLAQFKQSGGILLAAGMAEGIDLKDDLCRINIIPKLIYPNLMDSVVKKRMALTDGKEWYELQTLKVLMQQVGRSTRSESDYSTTFILDPGASRLLNKHRKSLPKSFIESIIWDRRPL